MENKETLVQSFIILWSLILQGISYLGLKIAHLLKNDKIGYFKPWINTLKLKSAKQDPS